MTLRFAALVAALFVVAGGALLVGGTALSPADVGGALMHPHSGGEITTIVWQLRLPRIVIGALVGAALAIAGALLQGLLSARELPLRSCFRSQPASRQRRCRRWVLPPDSRRRLRLRRWRGAAQVWMQRA